MAIWFYNWTIYNTVRNGGVFF
ncbi:hypothetical protein SBDP1_480025 [Syntrophobacter sp. SbD1]|nr:hypothetical protein SBDP1_480025 [Syntrophobacter sp. SbD1]